MSKQNFDNVKGARGDVKMYMSSSKVPIILVRW